jgi:myo-inositol 2-dehydrogenase / D-chiro-inositol 1-dehydrogenase
MSARVAILGAGRMGRERGRAAAALGARVSAVFDPEIGKARVLAESFGATVLTSAEQLDFRDLDAIFVCTPPGTRGALELAAVEAGVALFVEKPIGLNAESCRSIAEALRRRQLVNAVGYMHRYRASVRSARRALANAEVLGVSFCSLGARYGVPWWLLANQSGGPLNEQCTHFVDLCRFVVGEIASVHAVGRPLADCPGADGTVAMTLKFRTGTVGTGLYSCEASEKQIAFEVFLPGRSLRLEGWDLRLHGDPDDAPRPPREQIFVDEVAAFLEAVRTRDPCQIQADFESALKTQTVMDALAKSLSSGRSEGVHYPEAEA